MPFKTQEGIAAVQLKPNCGEINMFKPKHNMVYAISPLGRYRQVSLYNVWYYTAMAKTMTLTQEAYSFQNTLNQYSTSKENWLITFIYKLERCIFYHLFYQNAR